MRWQRNALKKSRPKGLGPPRASTHTYASYQAKYLKGGNASLSRCLRAARLLKREAAISGTK